MTDAVLTLIATRPAENEPGGLTEAIVAQARRALNAQGIETGATDWLSEGEAADIPFSGIDAIAARDAALAALAGHKVDAVAQPARHRKKRLLVADMDSTIVTVETLDELADFAGLKAKIAAITERAMNGEIGFADALRERVAMLEGLGEDALEKTLARVALTPGAKTLVATMKAAGAYSLLISGGFSFFTERVRAMTGFDEARANRLLVEGGRLTGRVAEPILNKDAKLAALKELAAARGLSLDETLAVGDGANDVPMLAAAGLSVAYRPHPVAGKAALATFRHADLTGILFAQGYRRAEFRD